MAADFNFSSEPRQKTFKHIGAFFHPAAKAEECVPFEHSFNRRKQLICAILRQAGTALQQLLLRASRIAVISMKLRQRPLQQLLAFFIHIFIDNQVGSDAFKIEKAVVILLFLRNRLQKGITAFSVFFYPLKHTLSPLNGKFIECSQEIMI